MPLSLRKTLAGFALPLALAGCGGGPRDELVDGTFTAAEWEVAQTLSPLLALPPDPTNKYGDNPAAALLGQKLFFEKRYSGKLLVGDDGQNGGLGAVGETGKVSCASCHVPESHFQDSRSKPGNVSLGTGYTPRNAPSLINAAYYEWYGWGGKQNSMWTQSSLSPESADNTGGNRCGYAHMLFSYYRAEYDALFDEDYPAALDPGAVDAARFPAACKPKKAAADPDGPWELMAADDREIINRIMANQGKAVAAYERKLISVNAPLDRYIAGDKTALTSSAKRGLKLFVGKAACVECHQGALLSDQKFHNLGIPQEGPNVPAMDLGRFTDATAAKSHAFNSGSIYSDDPADGAREPELAVPTEADKGAFRTKGLRGVEHTAPYFHTGNYATLEDVVDYYDEGGGAGGFAGTKDEILKPLNLTEEEKADLVAFLHSLTGDPIPSELLQPL